MTQYSRIVLADTPLAYYRLDETGGLIAQDTSGNGNNATLSASGITLNVTGALTGDSDPAMTFDGIAGSVTLPLVTTATTNVTLECWVNLPSTSAHGAAIKIGTSTGGYGIGFGTGSWDIAGTSVIGLFEYVRWILPASMPLSVGVWHHVVFILDTGGTPWFYVDGVSLGSVSGTSTTAPTSAAYLASDGAAVRWLQGSLDEVAIYPSVLSAGQVLAHYQAGTTTPSLTSSVSLAVFKQQTVLVYKADGVTFIDTWRDAPLLAGFKEAINSGTQPLKVQLPRSFDNFDEGGVTGNLGSIAQGNIIRYYMFGPLLPATGHLRFQGIIDAYEPQIAESGEESVTVTVTPFSAVVGDQGIVGTQTFGTAGTSATYVDPITMFTWWFSNNDPLTGKPYAYPLTLDPANPASSGVTASYVFQNQKLSSIFDTIIQMLPPNWFWRVNSDMTVTLNVAPVVAQHIFVLGQHLAMPRYTKDWTQSAQVAQVVGNGLTTTLTVALTSGTVYTSLSVAPLPAALVVGQLLVLNDSGTPSQNVAVAAVASSGATSVTVTSFTANAAYATQTQITIYISVTRTGSDVSAFPWPRKVQLADRRIVDYNTATILAQGLLTKYDQVRYRSRIRVIDMRGDAQTGIGYDIESIQAGDTCQILVPVTSVLTAPQQSATWDNALWDNAYWDGLAGGGSILSQVVSIVALSYGFDYVDLELGALQPNQDRALALIQQTFQDYTLV